MKFFKKKIIEKIDKIQNAYLISKKDSNKKSLIKVYFHMFTKSVNLQGIKEKSMQNIMKAFYVFISEFVNVNKKELHLLI